jgi:uncharacterized protein YecE (DUF72 family)
LGSENDLRYIASQIMAGRIYIGTSGWHYKHWIGRFYPKDIRTPDMLAFYARHFHTVEINNSFYRLPEKTTFTSWRDNSPQRFLFAVKASRFITHMKKLKDPKPSTAKFFLHVSNLKEKLGPILFQLPPRWNLNLERLQGLLEALPDKYNYAFELRDTSWLVEPIYNLLLEHNAAFCIYHLAGFLTPLVVTADFVYVRLHGPDGKYQGNYSRKELVEWATRLKSWSREGKSSYVYFDNDQMAYAAKNAQELQELVRK